MKKRCSASDERRTTVFKMAFFRDKFRAIFYIKETPHRISLAFAFGVFMGISPFLGLHYIGGISLAWLFRLNKMVTFIGISVNNPWTLVPICSGAAWIGAKLLGLNQILPDVDWKNIALLNIISKFTDLDNFIVLIKQMMPLISAFFVGSFVLCVPSAIVSYFIIRVLITRYRKIHDTA